MKNNVAEMGEVTKSIYVNRLRGLARRMLDHSERFREKLWEHHSTSEYQESCRVCFTYSCQFNRWSDKWWTLHQHIWRLENQVVKQ